MKVILVVYLKNIVFVGNIKYFGLCFSSKEYLELVWSELEIDEEGVIEGKKFELDWIRINY